MYGGELDQKIDATLISVRYILTYSQDKDWKQGNGYLGSVSNKIHLSDMLYLVYLIHKKSEPEKMTIPINQQIVILRLIFIVWIKQTKC